MSEEEYRRIVDAIAVKNFRPANLNKIEGGRPVEIKALIDRLSTTAEMLNEAREYPENGELRGQLGARMNSRDLRSALDGMRVSGALDALDDAPDLSRPGISLDSSLGTFVEKMF